MSKYAEHFRVMHLHVWKAFNKEYPDNMIKAPENVFPKVKREPSNIEGPEYVPHACGDEPAPDPSPIERSPPKCSEPGQGPCREFAGGTGAGKSG